MIQFAISTEPSMNFDVYTANFNLVTSVGPVGPRTGIFASEPLPTPKANDVNILYPEITRYTSHRSCSIHSDWLVAFDNVIYLCVLSSNVQLVEIEYRLMQWMQMIRDRQL